MTAVTLSERVYSMDVVFPLLVVGTAERNILIYNLSNPTVPYKVSWIGFVGDILFLCVKYPIFNVNLLSTTTNHRHYNPH